MKVQSTVKKETVQIAVQCGIACLVLLICFFFLHIAKPEKVSFDYRVILSAVLGTFVAVMNFYLMGITVQEIVNTENQEDAYQKMRASYRNRTMLQLIWIVIALIAPIFNAVACIIPLLFPGAFLRIRGVLSWKKNTKTQGGEN